MTPKQLVERQGYVFIPSFHPDRAPETVAAALGVPEQVEDLRFVQELSPTISHEATPNTYSGNFGLGAFPLHTDLAHWAMPPRYLMLRCAIGDPDIQTQILDSLPLVTAVGSSALVRCLVRPRRPVRGALQLLPVRQYLAEPKQYLLRWDSIYLQPSNEYAQAIFQQIKDWLGSTQAGAQVFVNKGDTLLLDNWRMLHGRSSVPDSTSSRRIHRIYLSSLI